MAARGSKPGERRGGRKAGTPNKATTDVRSLAQQYGSEALAVLASIMLGDHPAAARVSAAKEILDRGYGKSPQPIEGGTPLAANDDVKAAIVANLRR
jgi:hypothetical protein